MCQHRSSKANHSLIIKCVQNKLGQVIQQGLTWPEVRFKRWKQPTKTTQVASTLTDLTRSKSELIAENRHSSWE